MSRIEERLEVLGVDTSEMTTEEKFTVATGLTHYDEETAANDWYVPGGAANVPSTGSGSHDDEEVETFTAEEAAAYNATLPGAMHEGDEILDDETEVNYEVIKDAESWNNSEILPKYYELNPNEDRWNVTENRAGNFNDKVYELEIGNGVYEFAAHWETDDVQKITNVEDENEVYYLDMFYELDENEHELFVDAALSESADKTARFRKIKWSDETCPQCWEGAVNAPGAKLPWVAISFDDDVHSKVQFSYEGKEPVKPWGDTIFGDPEADKDWAIASVSKAFDDDTLKLEVLGGEGTFDESKFGVELIHVFTAEEALEFNAKLAGAVKAGDQKPNPSEIEVETENP